MRPSIAAALSTLGPLHSADAVLLTPTDVDRFADVDGPDEGNRRVIVRPDGSLLLVVEFDAPTFNQMKYAIVGAVEPSAWAWADPTKRASKEERVRRLEPMFYTVNLDTVFTDRVIAAWNEGAERLRGSKRTPKDGDTLRSLTATDLDALPVGAALVAVDGCPLTKRADGLWYGWGVPTPSGRVRAEGDPDRTLVLPKPAEAPKPAASPKVGDRLRDLTPEQRANLPIGTVLGGIEGWPKVYPTAHAVTKADDGRWCAADRTYGLTVNELEPGRPILSLPTPPPPAKVGDRWGNLTPDQRAALPVGTVLGAIDGLPPVVKVGPGWVGVEDGGKVGGFVPERTIAFLPVSK